jgi:hypothetical protein
MDKLVLSKRFILPQIASIKTFSAAALLPEASAQ